MYITALVQANSVLLTFEFDHMLGGGYCIHSLGSRPPQFRARFTELKYHVRVDAKI